jgi:hypothetical protein
MEYFVVAEVIDPQEAEESSITIAKPTNIIYRNISLRIDIAATKKYPAQVLKPVAVNLEVAQKARASPNKVEIHLLKEAT